MTITSTLRFLHGCFESPAESGVFYIPGLMQLSTDGLFYANNSGGYHTNLDLASVDPRFANGNTQTLVSKVELTPMTSTANVLVCDGTSSEPVVTNLCLLNSTISKCSEASEYLMGGHSCDVTLTTESNVLEVFLPSFMLGISDHEIYDYNGHELFLPLARDEVFSYELQDGAIYELAFDIFAFKDKPDFEYFEAPDYTGLNEISANDLSAEIPGCQTNAMGACDILNF